MTTRTSPEERARAIVRWIDGDPTYRQSAATLAPALASAIRAAEQEALERAAAEIDTLLASDRSALRRLAYGRAASTVRSLKTGGRP